MPDITISELELTPEIASTLQVASDDATGNTVKFTVSQLQEFITQATKDLLPDDTGQIKLFAFPTDAIPDSFDNYSLADGGELVRNDNAELFAKIGTAWGDGDGSTTFNKPNALNRFFRAYSDDIGAGVYYQAQATAANGLKFNGEDVGGHTHSRGTMDITGDIQELFAQSAANIIDPHGAFYFNTSESNSMFGGGGGQVASYNTVFFKASKTWTGTTSSAGGFTPAGTITGDAETRPVAIILVPYVQVRKFP